MLVPECPEPVIWPEAVAGGLGELDGFGDLALLPVAVVLEHDGVLGGSVYQGAPGYDLLRPEALVSVIGFKDPALLGEILGFNEGELLQLGISLLSVML